MAEVIRANQRRGHHFFDPATVRFFRGRVGRTLYGGHYFITSEQAPHSPRRWSVRTAWPDGRVTTMGEFGAYASHAQARAAIRALLADTEEGEP